MRKLTLLVIGVIMTVVAATPTRAANKFKRVAVMPFENTTKAIAIDWMGTGISESLITDLAKFPDFTLVERTRLNEALKEIKLGRSGSVDPATAQRMGKILGADAIVVGSYQVVADSMSIFARVIETETAEVRVTARVDGTSKNVLSLQTDIAAKLVEEMKGSLAAAEKKKLEDMPSKSVEAVQALSDGVYYLRTDLESDALKEFDRAISLDPNFTEAHYYRGIALAKLKRWDDAITSLKRTLPRAQAEQTVKWSWTPPVDAQTSQRGILLGIDQSVLNLQGPQTMEGTVRARKRFAYTERSGKNTVLHFLDTAKKTSSRVEIPDDSIPITLGAFPANDRAVIMPASTPARAQEGITDLYAVSAEGVLWRSELKGVPGQRPPDFDLWGQTLFEFYPHVPKIVALDADTHTKKWEREGLIAWLWHFKVKGNMALLTSPSDNKIHGVRVADGQDAWTIDYMPSASYQLVTDRALIVFEPEKRVFAADLQTGKIFADVAVPPLMFGTSNPYMPTVPALVDNNTLYFISSANELLAVDLNPAAAANKRVLWKTPLQTKFQTLYASASHLYGGAPTGELLVVDRASGAVRSSKKVSERPLTITYAGSDIVLGNTPGTLYGFEPGTGNKVWETVNVNPNAAYFKGLVLVQSSISQLGMLDSTTGNMVQQYTGSPVFFWANDDSLFILESNGVKEYGLDRTAIRGITNKEAMTELANVLLSKGDLDEAARFADRVGRESDPNYPPLRYVQAQLNLARGNVAAARREFVAYTDLVGHQSKAAQEVIQSMKARDGLFWESDVGGVINALPVLAEGRIIVKGPGHLTMVDQATGRTLWRQSEDGLVDFVYTRDDSKRILYASKESKDPKTFHIYSIGIDGSGRKELLKNTLSTDVTGLRLAYSRNRIFLETLSINPQSGTATITFSGINADSGATLWNKKHDLLQAQMAQPRATGGLFFPKGDRLVYSLGTDFWILNSQDGSVYVEQHESGPIASKQSYVEIQNSDPDAITYVVGAGDIVTYKLSSKQTILRTKVPSQDPGFSACACIMSGTTFIEKDGSSIAAFDIDPALDNAKRLKWRITPPPGQAYGRIQFLDDVLIVPRAPAGIGSQTDVVFLRLDFSTGKTLQEIQPLWLPIGQTFVGNRLIAATIDGMVYALDQK